MRDYWQRKPLLVRQAMPEIVSPLEPEELAGLALEEEIPSRLVIEHSSTAWEVRHGPFSETDFAALPPTHWSLLVNDLEKFVPRLRSLLEPFRFIADWRIDDLMISYAPPHGSVGPHTDAYDVFLLQLRGRRRWQIDTRPVDPENRLPNTELALLKNFEPQQEWVVQPGDLLYLPPQIAHYGVALDDCMTASIGFRAPSQKELLGAWLDDALSHLDPTVRYTDAGITPQKNPAEITYEARKRAIALLREALAVDDDDLSSWFGRYITEPRAELGGLYPAAKPWSKEKLHHLLAQGKPLRRNPAARLAWYAETGKVHFFADGEEMCLPPEHQDLVAYLCNEYEYRGDYLQNSEQEQTDSLLLWLLQRGVIEPEDEND